MADVGPLAGPDDARAVIALHRFAKAAGRPVFSPSHLQIVQEATQQHGAECMVLVARAAEAEGEPHQVVGALTAVVTSEGGEPPLAELLSVVVRADFRRQGVGAALLAHAVEHHPTIMCWVPGDSIALSGLLNKSGCSWVLGSGASVTASGSNTGEWVPPPPPAHLSDADGLRCAVIGQLPVGNTGAAMASAVQPDPSSSASFQYDLPVDAPTFTMAPRRGHPDATCSTTFAVVALPPAQGNGVAQELLSGIVELHRTSTHNGQTVFGTATKFVGVQVRER